VLQVVSKHGKLLAVKDGWLVCPTCRRNKRLLRIRQDTEAHRMVVYCRDCKTEHIVDISEGQCFESRSQ
jgi:uncharacterized protein YbaR (Trm112 family)